MRAAVWILWVAAAVAATVPAFLWHVTQFTKPGPAFLALIVGSLGALFIGAALHYALPNTRVHRYSPWLLIATPAVVCLLYQPLGTLLIGVMAVAAWLLGRAVLVWGGYGDDEVCAAIALPALAGFGLLMYAFFALGLLGFFGRPAFAVVLATAVAVGWRERRALPAAWRDLQEKWDADESLRSPLVSLCIVFMTALTALTAVIAVTPAIAADALTFHLNLTRSYVASGFMHPPETMPYGWFPQALEALMTGAWAFAGQPAAQLVGVLFFALGTLMIAALMRACGYGRASGIVAAAMTASIPLVHWSGSVVKNDLMLAAWLLAALYAVLRWRATADFRWILLSAFFFGLCMQVKLVAVFGAVPLFVLWLAAVWRQPQQRVAALDLAAVLLLFGSFTMVRNWLVMGNAFHPLQASSSIEEQHGDSSRLMRYVQVPWTLHFDSQRHFESSSHNAAGVATIVLLPAVIPFVRKRRGWQERACWWFIAAYLVYWIGMIDAARYATAALALLIALLAARATAVFDAGGSAIRLAVGAGVAWTLAFGWVVTVMIESYPAELPYLARRIDAKGFLRASLPPFGAMEFLTRTARREDWVLNLGAWAPVYGHNPDRILLVNRSVADFKREDLTEQLRDRPEFRWVVLPNGGPGPELARLLAELRKVRHVYGDEWFSVYRVEGS